MGVCSAALFPPPMSEDRVLPGVHWRHYAPEDPRHPRSSDSGLNTVHFNPSPDDVDAQPRHGWRRALQKHASASQGRSPVDVTISTGVFKQGERQ